MAIPPRFIDELKSRLSLSDIAGKRVKLSRAGREFKACCPFHNEKTPSFYINDDKQFYHCFGCGAHGSIIDFVMSHDNLSFIEAVETLAALAGMKVPQSSPEEVEKAQKEKSLYGLLEDAAKWMEAQLRLPANREAFAYMIERGVPEEQISAYRIGYAPGDGQAVRKHLLAQGYTDAQMVEAGVLRRSDRGGEPYAFFRERVMFPVPDRRGRIVAFGGRILPEHLRPPSQGDFKPPKYINSTDTPLFHKGRMLYGEPHARAAAAEGQNLIVVEGYLDVIACARAGYKGALAPLGTALTEEQILSLWKIIPGQEKVPVLCFDGDEAGRRAAVRACERLLPLLKPDHSARIAFLPEGQDPDTLINGHGAGAMEEILGASVPLVEFLWRHHTVGRRFETPESRAGLGASLEQDAARIADRAVQNYYRQAFQAKIREAFAPARPAYNNAPRPSWKGGRPQPSEQGLARLQRPGFSRRQVVECALLAGILNYPALFEFTEERLGHLQMGDKSLDRLRQAILSTLGREPDLDVQGLKTHLLEQDFGREISLILSESVLTHAGFVRPGKDTQTALSGWDKAWAALDREGEQADMKAAGTAYAQSMNDEAGEKMTALRDLYASGKRENA